MCVLKVAKVVPTSEVTTALDIKLAKTLQYDVVQCRVYMHV